MNQALSPAEERMMKMTCEATMRRCADVVDGITQDDLLETQHALVMSGVSIINVAKVDRAMLAAAHLRVCATLAAEDFKDETVSRLALQLLKKAVR